MMNVSAKSANESFARACISAFAAQLDPTLEDGSQSWEQFLKKNPDREIK